jgi:hypothetical protein
MRELALKMEQANLKTKQLRFTKMLKDNSLDEKFAELEKMLEMKK